MKKIRDYLIFYVKFILKKFLNSKPWVKDLKFHEFFFSKGKKNLEYISNKLRIVFHPSKEIGKFFIDTTLVKTNLCNLGKKFIKTRKNKNIY